jgi:hypothetical protein
MAQRRTHCVLDSQRATLFARVLAIALGEAMSANEDWEKVARGLVVEARKSARELKQKLDATDERMKELNARMERRRWMYTWQMPRWLWIPVVIILVAMFLIALYQVGQKGSGH